jgi:acylphosphatase
MKHLNIRIYGNVQGVGFRYYAQENAEKLGLKGFTCNKEDGTVYIEAEGKEEDLEKFLDWCHKGPAFARVERVEFEYTGNLKNFEDFNIKY